MLTFLFGFIFLSFVLGFLSSLSAKIKGYTHLKSYFFLGFFFNFIGFLFVITLPSRPTEKIIEEKDIEFYQIGVVIFLSLIVYFITEYLIGVADQLARQSVR